MQLAAAASSTQNKELVEVILREMLANGYEPGKRALQTVVNVRGRRARNWALICHCCRHRRS